MVSRIIFLVVFSVTNAFCNMMRARALCPDLQPAMENGCCRTNNECPGWCQVRQEVTNPKHIFGNWANGTRWNKRCICRFCLAPAKETISMAVQERMMRVHNFFRCLHAFPPFENWSFKMELNTKKQQEACILKHAKPFDLDPISGENKAVGVAMPEINVAMWYMEIENVDPMTQKQAGEDPIGHYTSMIWKDTKDIGCGLCYPVFQNEFTIGKEYAGNPDEPQFLWTCHYSNKPPNDKLLVWESLPDLRDSNGRDGKNARTMDQCCEMIYPEFYDNVTKLQPQIHENSDFMWLDFDLALPANKMEMPKRILESLYDENELRILKAKFGIFDTKKNNQILLDHLSL